MEDSTAEIFINQLKELVGVRKTRYVENKRRELPGAFSGDFGVSVVLFAGNNNSKAVPRRTNCDTFAALRESQIF